MAQKCTDEADNEKVQLAVKNFDVDLFFYISIKSFDNEYVQNHIHLMKQCISVQNSQKGLRYLSVLQLQPFL